MKGIKNYIRWAPTVLIVLFLGVVLYGNVFFSREDKRTSEQIEEDRLLQSCITEVQEAYTSRIKKEGYKEEFDILNRQALDQCIVQYHRGYREYLESQSGEGAREN